ncbi:MAG: amidohydrolase family protein, partial [Acidobacteriota bacterium]|nr:amidohydrolase family protein [Acidobacteriota bacterium]
GISYTPGASHEEIFRLFAAAATREAPVFIHLRSSGAFRAGGAMAPFQEAIANAAATGVALHIVHMNSSAGEAASVALGLVRGAQERGVDVTTEAYPYTASASRIESALFDGWDGRAVEDYDRLQWVETGERLTAETFRTYREEGGWVITHGRSEETNEWIVSQADVIAASDGIPFSQGRAHPRGAGTFARILGYYVRERGVLSLMDALRKMTLLPAQRLERIVPQMVQKGRVRVGADADLTIFDPATVVDLATYDAPDRYSEGIRHVLVAGTLVVKDGMLVPDVTPGQPIRSGSP